MTTERQIAANRANAQLSTGPRTEAGKTASAKNATRHQLTAQGLIILPGQEQAFDDLESGLRSKLIPNGPLDEVLFKRAVESAWNLERCRQAEFTLHQRIGHATSDPLLEHDDRYSRIHRYARESENSLYKAMRELGKLQAEAQFREEVCPLTVDQAADADFVAQTPHALSQVCLLTQVMKHVIAYRRNEPKTVETYSRLDALKKLHPIEFERRFESNPEPAPKAASAAAN